jgi:hypothetical protein
MFAPRFAASVAWLLLLSAGGRAQTFVVVPNAFADTAGTGASSLLISPQNNPRTVQIVWNANQLTDLVGAQITALTYRLSAALPNGYPIQTTTWSDYNISLGPSVLPSQASTTFANNFLAPPTPVRSGPLTVPPLAWPTGGGGSPTPTPWGFEIPFATPYLYTGGNLGLLVSLSGSDNPTFGNALLDSTGSASPGNGVNYTNISANTFNATTGVTSVFSTIVRLTATPVPEPLGLLALGLVALIPWARTLRRAAVRSR